jgi:ligand-binding sensor domain-containing protein
MRRLFRTIPLIPLLLTAALAGCSGGTTEPVEKGPPWRTYRRPATGGLLDNKVNSLSVDQFNRVWVATDSGANYYSKGAWGMIDRQNLQYQTFSQGGTITSYKVNAIAQGSYGTIWFGLDGGGVRRWRENAATDIWTTYKSPSLASNFIQSITGDMISNARDVWFTTLNGVSQFRPEPTDPRDGNWTSYASPLLATNLVRASAINETDLIMWFGTDEGLSYYNDLTFEWRSIDLTAPYDYRVNDIAFDGGGVLWMAKLVGVSGYDPVKSTWTHYTNENTGGKLPPGEVHAVAAQGTTRWFGTDAGVVRLQDTTWTTFAAPAIPEMPSNVVTALKVDRRGNLWIGTADGLAVFNEGGIVD